MTAWAASVDAHTSTFLLTMYPWSSSVRKPLRAAYSPMLRKKRDAWIGEPSKGGSCCSVISVVIVSICDFGAYGRGYFPGKERGFQLGVRRLCT